MAGSSAGRSTTGSGVRPLRGHADRSRWIPMSNLDGRPVSQGGSRHGARPLAVAERAGFVARHGLWSERQYADEEQMRRVLDELGVELVREAFSDQFGVLRGKTVTR